MAALTQLLKGQDPGQHAFSHFAFRAINIWREIPTIWNIKLRERDKFKEELLLGHIPNDVFVGMAVLVG